jgi:hypothetical protein
MPGFWDHALRRLHFAFVERYPDQGRECVQRVMENAFNQPRLWPAALFVLSPAGPGGNRPPVLAAESIQLLAVDCPHSNLGFRARQLARPAWPADRLLAALKAAEPPDVTGTLAQARLAAGGKAGPEVTAAAGVPENPGEGAAQVFEEFFQDLHVPPTPEQMQQGDEVGRAFRPLLCAFLGRVSETDPAAYQEPVLEDFVHLWRRYLAGRTAPQDFWLLSFGPLVRDVVHRVSPPQVLPARTWVEDPAERLFLECCAATLSHVDRVALFLVLYGALDVRQVVRVLRAAVPPGWAWAANPETAMDHLTERWVDVVEEMARRAAGPFTLN